MIRLLFSGTVALIGMVFLCGIAGSVNAQRLDDFGKGALIKVQGSVSLDQMAYYASGIAGRRDPYNFYLNAALNLDIYGWAVPFSFSYSNQSRGAFQQPFNQFSLNPSYKWVTASVGNQSASFSGYTLNGHAFSGLGLELSPQGPWKYHVLAGRFQKATHQISGIPFEPAYQRYGYGIKVGYHARDQYDLILFKAHDHASTLNTWPLVINPNPQDNLVLGFNVKKRITKSVSFKGEVGLSALTQDLRVVDSAESHIPDLGFLLQSNSSTAFHKAIKAGMDYSLGKVIVGIGYERVDPEYKTLGSYYFNNDLQNFTGNLSARFLEDKVSLAVNAGVQNNDLNQDKQSSMRRFVGAVNLGMNFNSRLNLTSSYSNFQSYTNIRSSFQELHQLTPYENLDTLNFRQIAQNANVGANYILGKDKEKTSVLNINVAWFISADHQGGQKQDSGGGFYNFNGSYALNLVPKNISFQVGLNANKNASVDFPSMTYGPTAGLSGTFFEKKLRNNLVISWNQSKSEPAISASILNARLSSAYAYRKKHSMSMALVFMHRQGAGSVINQGKMHEYTATFGYRYTL